MRERNWPNWSTGTWKSPVERAVKEWAPHDVARCFALFSRVVLTPSKSKLAYALIWGESHKPNKAPPPLASLSGLQYALIKLRVDFREVRIEWQSQQTSGGSMPGCGDGVVPSSVMQADWGTIANGRSQIV